MEFDSVSPRIITDLDGNSGLCSRSNGVVASASDALEVRGGFGGF